MVLEELVDVPLYYTLDRLAATLRVETPPMMTLRCNTTLQKRPQLKPNLDFRSAILNAGYRVSYTHMNRTSIKTDAPARVIWDIMRCWAKTHPASKKRLAENKVAANILGKEPEKEYSFEPHPNAIPQSKQQGLRRFQENPLPFWGPGSRSQAM